MKAIQSKNIDIVREWKTSNLITGKRRTEWDYNGTLKTFLYTRVTIHYITMWGNCIFKQQNKILLYGGATIENDTRIFYFYFL